MAQITDLTHESQTCGSNSNQSIGHRLIGCCPSYYHHYPPTVYYRGATGTAVHIMLLRLFPSFSRRLLIRLLFHFPLGFRLVSAGHRLFRFAFKFFASSSSHYVPARCLFPLKRLQPSCVLAVYKTMGMVQGRPPFLGHLSHFLGNRPPF